MATLSLTASTADYQTYRHDFARGEQDYNPATVHKFVAEMKRQGMLLNEFSWDDWYQNSHMVDRPEYIADASLYECRLLLSAWCDLSVSARVSCRTCAARGSCWPYWKECSNCKRRPENIRG